MTEVTIDGIVYDFDSLSEKAKQEFMNLHATDIEIQRLTAQMAIAQTARVAYATALKTEIPQVTQ